MYAIQGKKRVNSRKYEKVIFESEKISEILKYMHSNKLRVIEKPYIFTHLILNNDYILTNSYNGIIVSPQDIAEILDI